MKHYLLFICIVLASLLKSQSNLEKGDRYFEQNMFSTAAKYYQTELKSKNKKTKERAYKRLADCYRISGEFELAEELYKKIIKKYKKDPSNFLNYGLSLKSSSKYAEASLQFQEYIKLAPNDPMGVVYLNSCDSAQLWLDENLGQEVKNMVSINSEESDFSPIFLPNGELLFCSARPGSKEAFISFNGGFEHPRLDLYRASLADIKSTANSSTSLKRYKNLNTPAHEGSACLSADGSTMYFTKTVKGKKNKVKNKIVSTLQIYVAHLDSLGKWGIASSAFEFNSNEYSVAHPSISSDGTKLFFMSDMPGGFGHTDIYYCVKDTAGKWSKPINAGNEVNTFGYELFPFIAHDNTLYFSSNAHPGMGQLDIFSARLMYGKYSSVHNLRPPINSIGNDFGITIDPESGYGMFSSDRFNGKGAEDIYSFAPERPITFELHHDTLMIANMRIFDDILYAFSGDSLTPDLQLDPIKNTYFAVLENEKSYKLIAKKHGLKIAEIELSYKYLQTEQAFELALLSKKSNIQARGFYACKPVSDSTRCLVPEWLKLQENETNASLSQEGVLRYQFLAEKGKSVVIQSANLLDKN